MAAGAICRNNSPPGPGAVKTRMIPASGRSRVRPKEIKNPISAVGSATPLVNSTSEELEKF